MKIIDVLEEARVLLKESGNENYFFEARMLLENVLKKTKEWIVVHENEEIKSDDLAKFNELVRVRSLGKPLQYIIGKSSFMGNDFIVNENVLIPRADTEVWVERVINIIDKANLCDVLDLCTGSGCIAISIKKALERVNMSAIDISEGALEVAKSNAKNNGTDIEFIKSDLFNDIKEKKFDVIVSNPPYIPTKDINMLQKEVLNEPFIALDGGDDGLDFYKKIIKGSDVFLRKGGYLALEFGYNQFENVKDILIKNNFEILEVIKDYSGNIRSIISKKG